MHSTWQSRSKAALGDAREVGELAQHGDPKEDVSDLSAGSGIERVVDKVGHKGGKAPVVTAVLEQVSQRHGAVAEPAQMSHCPVNQWYIISGCHTHALLRCETHNIR